MASGVAVIRVRVVGDCCWADDWLNECSLGGRGGCGIDLGLFTVERVRK